MRPAFLAVSAALMVGACAMPSTTVRTTDTRPSLAVQGAPGGALLFIDGQNVGEASFYDGQPNVLRIEAGTHDVDVRDPTGRSVFHERVFVESETKIIEVH